MLKCAARGKADLLDFDAVDPIKLMSEKIKIKIEMMKNRTKNNNFVVQIVSFHKLGINSQ